MSVNIEKKVSNENCCAKDCDSLRSRNPELHFHLLPRPNAQRVEILSDFGVRESWDRRELWIHRLQIRAKKSLCVKVCSKHFIDSDYLLPADPSKKNHLKRNAIPSRNLPKQLPIKRKEPENIDNACTNKDFDASNLCVVKLEEPESDVEMQIEKHDKSLLKPPPTKRKKRKHFENACVSKDFDLAEELKEPEIENTVRTKHTNIDQLKIEESESREIYQNATFIKNKMKIEDEVVLLKSEEDEDVIYIEPDVVKDDVVSVDGYDSEVPIEDDIVMLLDDSKAIHEISNVKVMIIDNNAVLVESETESKNLNTDKSVQVDFGSFYETIVTATQLFTLTGIVNFKILDEIVESVRENLPKKLEHAHPLVLEDRVLFCLVKSHLKLPIVALAFFFKISPGAAGVISKEYYDIVIDNANKFNV